MIQLQNLSSIYFVGIGGIGMSALARFFHHTGKNVAGYDRTETRLTGELEAEGIAITFADDVDLIPDAFRDAERTLVVYTPAVPNDHRQLLWFVQNGFHVAKRSRVLGLISEGYSSICVAGTHGKTTVTTLTAHLLKQSELDCHAFLGGIAKNYQTNYLSSPHSRFVVLEADEFDRSFLTLSPSLAVITATDADHLDIYGDQQTFANAFEEFAAQVKPHGMLVAKKGTHLKLDGFKGQCHFSYSLSDDDCDFYAKDIRLVDGFYHFAIVTPEGVIDNLVLGVPGLLNVENAVAAVSLAVLAGATGDEIRKGLASFLGIRRRFDYWLRNEHLHLIDDYAHHPEEIRATATSVKALYPGKKIVAVFQPHLFSRTYDFYKEFATSLSIFDEVLLMDIYPARELPIKGVTSQMIANLMTCPVKLCPRNMLAQELMDAHPDVVITMGAGDIDKELPLLKETLEKGIS